MSILGQMYRNIAVHCFEGETLFICFGHFVAEHLCVIEESDKGFVLGIDLYGPFTPDVDGNVYALIGVEAGHIMHEERVANHG